MFTLTGCATPTPTSLVNGGMSLEALMAVLSSNT
jgi:hypothetical protein